jgi:hypothetical protein
MSRMLVCVAAGFLGFGALWCIRNLLHREFLSNVRVQRILQSFPAKGRSTVEILPSTKGATCSEVLKPLVAGHIHGVTYRKAGGGVFILAVYLGKLLTVDSGWAVR